MSRPRGITRQYEVLEAVRAFRSVHHKSPTLRNLMELTGISSLSLVHIYLNRLEEEGLIKREKRVRQSIELVGTGKYKNVDKVLARRSLALGDKSANKKVPLSKAESGRQGKGSDAFHAKVSKKDVGLDARIEAVVEKALGKGDEPSGEDVMLNRRLPFNRRTRVRSVRVV